MPRLFKKRGIKATFDLLKHYLQVKASKEQKQKQNVNDRCKFNHNCIHDDSDNFMVYISTTSPSYPNQFDSFLFTCLYRSQVDTNSFQTSLPLEADASDSLPNPSWCSTRNIICTLNHLDSKNLSLDLKLFPLNQPFPFCSLNTCIAVVQSWMK